MSPYSGLRNIILIGSLFGFHGLLNRSLLIDGVDEIYIVTSRITIVTLILFLYCFKEFKSQINFNTLLKGSWTGFLAIFIPGWTFIYAVSYTHLTLPTILLV